MSRKFEKIFMYSLAGCVMILLFIMLYIVIFVPIPKENEKLVYMAFGVALGWGTIIIGYFFASSIGSARKEEMLNEQRNKPMT